MKRKKEAYLFGAAPPLFLKLFELGFFNSFLIPGFLKYKLSVSPGSFFKLYNCRGPQGLFRAKRIA